MSFESWLASARLSALSWIDLVARLRTAAPEAELVLWSHEDAALIWPDILSALIGPEGRVADLEGTERFVCSLLLPEAESQLSGYTKRHSNAAERHAACRAFLERFACKTSVATTVELPRAIEPAGEDMPMLMTERYERDIAALRCADDVRFLVP
jgi:hypothetical protein